MKYIISKWSIKKLYDTFKKKNLNLSPQYQRNFIWSIKDQQTLIESILKPNPIPNFFLLQKGNSYEMVDGQQRGRTIIGFLDGQFKDINKHSYSKQIHGKMLDYEFPVTIITDTEGESIEKFYAMVNKTGIHLNKTEIRKADFYSTNINNLVEEINSSKKFKALKIFTESSLKRMNDIEFISELLVLIKDGHVDKKNHIDDYFSNDLTKEECGELNIKFNNVLDKISSLNTIFEINKTRYKQRNDFYTLFDFVYNYSSLKLDTLQVFYKILVLISGDIKPTQEKCEALKEYARNCVTQSNSKNAREHRFLFFKDLLINKSKSPNKVQRQILSFYGLQKDDFVVFDGFLIINWSKLNVQKHIEFEDAV